MRLVFDRSGPADGLPVVLLHGLSGSRRSYDDIVGHVDPVRPVLNADLRGHGESPRADSYRAVDFAADVAELIRAECDGPAVVVGHSLGGLTGSVLAAAAPELVAGLFLEDPPLYEGDDEIRAASPAAAFFPQFVAAIRAWQAGAVDAEKVAAAIGLQPSPHGGTTLQRLGRQRIAARAMALLDFDPRAMDAAISGETWEGYDPSAAVRCPVTLLRADPAVGAVFRPDDEAPFRAAVPQAEVVMAPGQAHGIHDDPEGRALYLDALDRFLAGLG